ncbi:MAG: MOSC domain-containing protein [Planctomycetaceae bacterium]|nr:MOSC domain-containing protein [Planctomycetaceae bacterium]
MQLVKDLLRTGVGPGRVEWLGIASSRRAEMTAMTQVELVAGEGIVGEHHRRKAGVSRRQVTLIQHEHLSVVASLLKREAVLAAELRRNVVVSGINLAAVKKLFIQVGTSVLEVTGNCPPCSRMEENLGSGGYAAMIGHGGITAIVLESGFICLGDEVRVHERTFD